MSNAVKTLEVAEIRGCCWLSLVLKMFIIFCKMVRIARKNKNSYPKGKSPWSSKMIYLGMNIRLANKEEED